jgi:hypothetical protein
LSSVKELRRLTNKLLCRGTIDYDNPGKPLPILRYH